MSAEKTSPSAYQQILGIRFFVGSADEAVQIGMGGGLVVVPAAPALVDLETDEFYREALLHADLALTDSGLMVLLWRILAAKNISRVSGLKYLKLLFDKKALQPRESVLWVMPNAAARGQNLAWLRSQGYDFTEANCYLAPNYPPGQIKDDALVALVTERKPRHIVVCIGGGTQERLGLMLKRASGFPSQHPLHWGRHWILDWQPGPHSWLGRQIFSWLAFPRCLSEPGKFVPRYWKACKLVPMMVRYRDKAPRMKAHSHGEKRDCKGRQLLSDKGRPRGDGRTFKTPMTRNVHSQINRTD